MFRQPGANATSRGLDPDYDRNPLCFQDGPLGIDVCLTCFNGGCLDTERHHAIIHYKKSGHKFALNVKRRGKPSSRRVCSDLLSPPVVIVNVTNKGRG